MYKSCLLRLPATWGIRIQLSMSTFCVLGKHASFETLKAELPDPRPQSWWLMFFQWFLPYPYYMALYGYYGCTLYSYLLFTSLLCQVWCPSDIVTSSQMLQQHLNWQWYLSPNNLLLSAYSLGNERPTDYQRLTVWTSQKKPWRRILEFISIHKSLSFSHTLLCGWLHKVLCS